MRKFRTLAVAVTLGLLLIFSGCSQASESSNTVDDIVSSVFEDETTAEVTTEEPTTEEPTTEEPTTEEPTEKPTEKPTQKPTKKPVKKVVEKHEDKSSQAETTLEFTNVTSSVSAGSFASVSIHGAPNTTYSITVVYNSGISTASGLEDVTSDSNGNASWSWKVGTRTKSDVVSADEKLFSAIRSSYKDEIGNVEITFDFTAKLGENPVLVASDGVHTVKKISDTVTEKAINRPIDKEKCEKQLKKTGSTAYNPTDVNINIDDNISIPLSVLNSLRRDVLNELDTARSVVHNYKINRDYEIAFPKFTPPVEKSTRARVTQTKLSDAFKKCELVFVPLFADKRELVRLKNEGFNIGVEIPRGMFGREDTIAKKLSEMKEIGISDVLCNNLGALYIAKNLGFTLHSGFGMNFVNTLDLLWAEEYGIKDAELSFELDFKRINALGGNIPRGIISYGYLPLMLCRSCPVRGAGIECKSCKNQSKMKDRIGKQFLLKCDGNCTEVLNCDLLFVSDKQLLTFSTSFNIFRFTVENYVETVESLNESSLISMLKEKLTYGLYRN